MAAPFLPAILGPEMAAPLLWAAGIFAFVLQEHLNAQKILVLDRGGVFWVFWGGEVLGVVSPHLPGEIFRAIFVSFSQF